MPVDPNDPTVIFLRALHDKAPTEDQLESLDPDWAELVKAAIAATPINRRAAVVLIKSGQSDNDRLLGILRGQPAPQDQPWPDPTPFGTPRLPSFPDRALPPWLGNYVRSESRVTQTPVDLTAMLALAVLSAACAGPIVLNPWGDWIEPLNLFTMVVLPPGHRKSAVFNNVTAPLHQFEADAARAAAPLLALARRRHHAAEQALLRAQDAAILAPIDDPRRPQLLEEVDRRLEEVVAAETPVASRLIADDCSPERLAMLLAEHGGRLAILSPEGGIFDLIAGRYSSTGAPNLDHYLKGHAGDPIVVDRVGRAGEIIPHPALTVGLAVQPEVLRSLLARPGFHGRGLLARFLYAIPNTTLGRRAVDLEPVDHGIRTYYHHHIRALLNLTHPTTRPSTTPPGLPLTPPVGALLAAPAADLPRSHPATPDPALPGLVGAQGVAPAGDLPRSHYAAPLPLAHPALPFGLPLSRARERGTGGEGFPRCDASPIGRGEGFVLPFDDFAADRLMEFAEAIEPRLAPDGDLDPIVDWASKLVGATARIAGLLHLATLPVLDDPSLPLSAPERGLGGRGDEGAPWWDGEVSLSSVEAAIAIAEYLIEHARAAYAAMGLDPTVANVPALLAWVRRTGRATFTRRDARHAVRSRIRSDLDLDDALEELEHHGYIRTRPAQYAFGRPHSPVYDVHPSIVRR